MARKGRKKTTRASRKSLYIRRSEAARVLRAEREWEDVIFRLDLTGKDYEKAKAKFILLWIKLKNPYKDIKFVRFVNSLPRFPEDMTWSVRLECGHTETWNIFSILRHGKRAELAARHLPISINECKCRTCQRQEAIGRRFGFNSDFIDTRF